eukprot:215853-Prymnesium_polylepis.2
MCLACAEQHRAARRLCVVRRHRVDDGSDRRDASAPERHPSDGRGLPDGRGLARGRRDGCPRLLGPRRSLERDRLDRRDARQLPLDLALPLDETPRLLLLLVRLSFLLGLSACFRRFGLDARTLSRDSGRLVVHLGLPFAHAPLPVVLWVAPVSLRLEGVVREEPVIRCAAIHAAHLGGRRRV